MPPRKNRSRIILSAPSPVLLPQIRLANAYETQSATSALPNRRKVAPVTKRGGKSTAVNLDDATGDSKNESQPLAGVSRESSAYTEYVESVFGGVSPFWQLTAQLYIASGWSARTEQRTVSKIRVQATAETHENNRTPGSTYKHKSLDAMKLKPVRARPGEQDRFASTSGSWRTLVMRNLPKGVTSSLVSILITTSSNGLPPSIDRTLSTPVHFSSFVVTPRPGLDDIVLELFSVAANDRTLKSRAVVEYTGVSSGGGKWSCSRDIGVECTHITSARRIMFNQHTSPGTVDNSKHVEGANHFRKHSAETDYW